MFTLYSFLRQALTLCSQGWFWTHNFLVLTFLSIWLPCRYCPSWSWYSSHWHIFCWIEYIYIYICKDLYRHVYYIYSQCYFTLNETSWWTVTSFETVQNDQLIIFKELLSFLQEKFSSCKYFPLLNHNKMFIYKNIFSYYKVKWLNIT